LILSVTVDDSSDSENSDYPKISTVLEKYLREIYPDSEKYESAEVSLSFVSSDEIRKLNRDYRDVDEATDVLSFPMIDDVPDGMPVLMLGDIVVCPEMTEQLHPELSRREAVCLMIAHSFLHLLGYDHEDEEHQKAMWAKQDEIARKILEVL